MSITTWTELKASVADWLADTTLTSVIPDFIMMGEKRIYRELRIRAMETALSETIASGVIAVPSDYVELKNSYVDGTPTQRLERKSSDFIYDKYPTRSSSGKPCFIAREAGNFIFGPYPDSTYTIKGVYYKRLDALSASNETNWFITNAPDLLLFASLMSAEKYLKNDNRVSLWAESYFEIKQMIEEEDRSEGYSGSPMVATSR